jgi:DNA-binding NarL/FixJ family response regulator
VRIVLAEDHTLMREGTRRILEQHPDLTVVGEAGDGEQALALVKSLQPDVAILDIRMPKLNGIEVVRRIKDYCPHTKTLVLSGYDDDDYVLAAMEAGATGYLLKTAQAKELVESVRCVQSGETVLYPIIAAKVARLWASRRIPTEKGSVEQLSSREMEVLELAAKGLRNKDIGSKLNISTRTVEGHFNNIFTKLEVSSRIEAILYAVSKRLVILDKEQGV